MATELQSEQTRAGGIHPRRLDPRAAVLRQLLRREGRIVRARRGLRRRVSPAAPARKADSGSSRTAVPVPGRDDEKVSAGLHEAAAAGIDDRASERRSPAVARADRRVAHARIERLIESVIGDRSASGNCYSRAADDRLLPIVADSPIARLPMSFLDRFKPQPRWKHADPAVRAAAVAEIPDDRGARGAMLRSSRGADEDVARAARPPSPGRRRRRSRPARAHASATPSCAARSPSGSSAIATRRADTDGDAALALEGLDDPKQFSTDREDRRRTTPFAPRRSAASTTSKALGSVARHAADPQTALDAVARIADPAELLNIALKTEHKDAGVAALERRSSRRPPATRATRSKRVGNRAKNKGGREARARDAPGDRRSRSGATGGARAVAAAGRRRSSRASKRSRAAPSMAGAAAQLADAERNGAKLSSNAAFELDQDTTARFGALVADAHGRDRSRTSARRRSGGAAERDAPLRRAPARRSASARSDSRRRRARRDRESARASGKDCPAREQEIEDARAARRASRRRAAARPSGTQNRAGDRNGCTRGSTSCRSRPSGSRPRSSCRATRGTPCSREWRTLLPKSDGLDPAVSERFAARRGARAAARRRAPGGRRTGAPAAGAAHRTADRARDQARGGRRPDAA